MSLLAFWEVPLSWIGPTWTSAPWSTVVLAATAGPAWKPVVWVSLVLASLLGLTAVVSPRLFATFSEKGSRWIDTQKILACLDKRYDIDHLVLPFSRCLGAVLLVAIGALAAVLLSR